MNAYRSGVAIILFCIFLFANKGSRAQEPDLSKQKTDKEKIAAWIAYCESLRLNTTGLKNNYTVLQAAALKGVAMTGRDDDADRARFFFYAGFGSYYQVKFDSSQNYLYQSLHEAQASNSTESIASACVALIPLDFQLQQPDREDSLKNILQSILDTTHNKKILQDGYSALGQLLPGKVVLQHRPGLFAQEYRTP